MPDTMVVTAIAKYCFFYLFCRGFVTVKSCNDQVACAFERPAEDLDLLDYVFYFIFTFVLLHNDYRCYCYLLTSFTYSEEDGFTASEEDLLQYQNGL